MGILDDIEKMDESETLKASLKRIEKLEDETNKLLKEILKSIRSRSIGRKTKDGERK